MTLISQEKKREYNKLSACKKECLGNKKEADRY